LKSFRRYYLDKCLKQYSYLIKGKVLDVGGKKIDKRGGFDISLLDAEVTYLNNDRATKPDIHSDAKSIPIGDNYFDTVISTELLEYVPNPCDVLEEIYRVSKKNSNIILSIPFLHPIHGDFWQDRYRLTALQIQNLCNDIGFEVNVILPMGSVGAVFFDILKVSFGYGGKSKLKSFYLLILRFFRVFFVILDRISKHQSKFINTGYFIILKKV